MKFHTVLIIYNPNSTGPSRLNAQQLESDLKDRGYDGTVELIETQFAGHAEEIASERGQDASTLIISSSGDGGYNEVVNGVIQATGNATVAVLPSGNANDHADTVGTDDFLTAIVRGDTKDIDCLRVSSSVDGKPWTRFAHSYVGFGMTPSVGRLLTQKRPNVLTEKWYVLRHVLSFRHVTLLVEGRRRRLTNLVIALIPKMSKIVKLDEDASVTDGQMEVYVTRYVSRIKVLLTLIGIGLTGIASQTRTDTYAVRTIRPTLIQLDGEVIRLDAGNDVSIVCEQKRIRTLA